jgi:ABC-type glycerol-3-phosphate transport system substrate-binding protein
MDEMSPGAAWSGAAHGPATRGSTRRGVLRVGGSTAAAAVAVLAAACGGQPGASAPKPANLSGTLVYRDWRLRSGNPVDEAFYKAVRDGFLAKYPNAKWEQEQVPFGTEYLQKMVASAAAGTSPQAVFSSIIWARDLWEQGLLEDLGPYVAKTPSVAPKQYVEPALFYNSWKGKTFGIPHVGPDFRVLYVNRKLLKDNGIDVTDEALAKWTWTDMQTYHQKLVQREGDTVKRAGIWFNPSANLEDFTTYLYANGGQFYNKDRNAVAFNNAQGQQVLEFFADWRTKYRGHEGPQGVTTFDAFLANAAAVVSLGSWNMRDIRGNPASESMDYTMMNIPRGPSGKAQATTAWSNMTVLPKDAKNKDLAWAFVEYYSSLEVAKQQFDIWKQVSPRLDFLDSAEWKQAQQKVPAYAPWRKISDTGGSYAYLKNADVGEKVEPLFKDAAINNKMSVRDALAEAERQANMILAQVK